MNLNRYRIVDGKYIFYTFQDGQKFNKFVWLENDGRFITKEDGSYYEFYNEDGSPDTVKNAELTYEKLTANYKGLYLGIVNTKLKELDYDSLATVKLWESDATFGAEATQILNWYKAIIALNYQILNDVTTGVRPIPTDAEYLAEINGIVF